MNFYKKNTKALLIAFMQLIMLFAKAQNLVSNGYFEIHDTCPNNISQITYAVGWHAATSTPDYFNACSPVNIGISVPYNYTGYQQDCCGGGGTQVVICLIKMLQITMIENIYTPS